MKTKSFNDLINTKLSKDLLNKIEKQAQLEVAILRSIHTISFLDRKYKQDYTLDTIAFAIGQIRNLSL